MRGIIPVRAGTETKVDAVFHVKHGSPRLTAHQCERWRDAKYFSCNLVAGPMRRQSTIPLRLSWLSGEGPGPRRLTRNYVTVGGLPSGPRAPSHPLSCRRGARDIVRCSPVHCAMSAKGRGWLLDLQQDEKQDEEGSIGDSVF